MSGQLVVITAAEFSALEGQPHAVRALYFELRRRADKTTGVVGDQAGRRLSWRALQEALYIEPEQGQVDAGLPAKTTVRRWAARLARAGLIDNLSEGKRLVILCRLAHRVQERHGETGPAPFCAPKKPGTNPAQTRHSQPGTAKKAAEETGNVLNQQVVSGVVCGLADAYPGTNPAQTRHSQPGTHQKSEYQGGSREDSAQNPRAHALGDAFLATLARLGARLPALDVRLENTRGNPGVRELAQAWERSGVPLYEFETLVAERLAANPTLSRVPPGYFVNAAREYLVRRTASAPAPDAGATHGLQEKPAARRRDTATTPHDDALARAREEQALSRQAAQLGIKPEPGEALALFRLRVQRAALRAARGDGAGSDTDKGMRRVSDLLSGFGPS